VRVSAYQGLQYDIMQASDLAITIPGSNTAEMAGLGLPMVVALPLNKPESLPLEGIPGLIGRIPVFGPSLKRAAVLKAAARVK
jgi:lipid-A-disaccharide synthase